MRMCEVSGCPNRSSSRGLCATHVQRKKKGIPLDAPVLNRMWSATHYERLDAYTDKRGPDDCWEWTRGKTKGYGVVSVGNGKHMSAHVAAWERANNRKLPQGMVILHTCDNPGCCNPNHLRLGTHADNVQDKVNKGRQLRGEQVPTSKLTRAQVDEIRARYAAGGVQQKELGAQYGVSQPSVSVIVNKRIWND